MDHEQFVDNWLIMGCMYISIVETGGLKITCVSMRES